MRKTIEDNLTKAREDLEKVVTHHKKLSEAIVQTEAQAQQLTGSIAAYEKLLASDTLPELSK